SMVYSRELKIENTEFFEEPFHIMVNIGNENEDYSLPAAMVLVDGKEIFKPSDFKKGSGPLSRKIILSASSDLEVKLDGETGSYVEVTILGWLKDDLMVDIDGNIYRTVKIGSQVWMAENLRVTKFNDGTPIPLVKDAGSWYRLTTPGYCWYDNDSASYHNNFGILYNYYAINSGNICPEGWHIPTGEEFRKLVSTLDPGADFVRHEASLKAGGKLKESGTTHWADPNTGATNASGFTALPGGCRSYAGNFSNLGTFGYFGGCTDEASLALRYATGSVFMRDKVSRYVGVSVRCVKD
ncbi:MAG TPA: hypothetical protein ENN61_00340, partial [Bacteroidaceae bacterium]|nr:hypothetical protein [Bacteroidaceae bacterium]